MSSEWKDTTIGDICTKVFSGGTPSSTRSDYYDGGAIPWLRTKEVNYSKIYATEQCITSLGFENSSVKLVPVNSVIVAMYGNGDTAGRVAINKVPLTTNQACCNLVVDPGQADYRYVYYYLMGQYKALVDLKNGGAQQNLNGQLIKAFPVSLPSVAVQSGIASFLEALDDRVTLLRETNATLEAIAQALFKSWFVDFDPVRAKMAGRAPEGMDEATAALFPDALEETVLGLVPKGWRLASLSSISTVTMGLSPKGESYNSDGVGIPLINGPVEFGDYFPVQSKWTTAGERMAKKGDLIFCVRGSTTGRRVIADDTYCIGRGVCSIRANDALNAFLYQTITFGLDRLLANTTGSVFPSLSGPDIKGFQVLLPSVEVLRAYERVVAAVVARQQCNQMQMATLAEIRDQLLPRVISGQLRLPEAQAQLEPHLT